MIGRAEKGIIITTSGFSNAASQEAAREGAPKIELGRVNTNDGISAECEMNEEHENAIELVESGEDAAKALQSTKQPFDLVALFVHFLVVLPNTHAVTFWRYDGKHFRFQYQLPRFIAFIGFVRDDMRAFQTAIFKGFQQLSPLCRITRLTRRKRKGYGCSGIGSNHVNFGGPACARFTNRLWTVFLERLYYPDAL